MNAKAIIAGIMLAAVLTLAGGTVNSIVTGPQPVAACGGEKDY